MFPSTDTKFTLDFFSVIVPVLEKLFAVIRNSHQLTPLVVPMHLPPAELGILTSACSFLCFFSQQTFQSQLEGPVFEVIYSIITSYLINNRRHLNEACGNTDM